MATTHATHPGGHDIRHAGGAASGRRDGLLRTAGDGIGLRAPAFITLLVIDGLLAAGSRRPGRPLILTVEQRQPVVDRNTAGGVQTRRVLEGKHIGPRVIAVFAIDRGADQRLHRFDILAAAVVFVLYCGQGLCQHGQGLGTGDAIRSQAMFLLVVLCSSLLLDGEDIADRESHQQAVGTDRLLAVALTAVL